MTADQPTLAAVEELSPRELSAMANAAAWYVKYHERMIAEQLDDQSALAVTRREHFENLHSALAKLGVRLRRPEGLGRAR
jgi:hypothetical protein